MLGPPGPPGPKPGGPSQPYSRFNISEPNMAQYKSSPVGYRHTINHENSSQVQNNLKAMLGQQPKHQTLDMGGQSAAIHHLRMQGLDQQGRRQQDNNLQNSQNSAYEGADSLRNQANKMFARNGGERSSVGYNQGQGQPSGHPGPGGSQGHPGGSQGHPGGNQGHPPPVTYPSHFPNSPHNQSQHSLNQSMEKGSGGTPGQGRARTNSAEEAAKRNSYGNQSFRTAVQQQQQTVGPGGPGGPGAPPPRQGRQVQQSVAVAELRFGSSGCHRNSSWLPPLQNLSLLDPDLACLRYPSPCSDSGCAGFGCVGNLGNVKGR